MDTLENVLVHEMSDLLSAEQQFLKTLKKMARSADSDEVKQLANEHHDQTQQQIDTLKAAFSELGSKPEKMVCKGAQGIAEENEGTIKDESKGVLRDLALLSGGMRVEHYEIAGYTSAVAIARALKQTKVATLLQQILKQEKETAKMLEKTASELLKSAPAEEK